ncbi:MAG: hypothetical protein QXI26_06570 [Metallosphaera sp.]
MNLKIWIPAALVGVILVAFFLSVHFQPSLPLSQGFINSTLGPGSISQNSGPFVVSDGTVVVSQLNGERYTTYLFTLGVGIYQPSQVSSGIVEYFNGTNYHGWVVVLNLKNVVSSNYTQLIKGNGTITIIVHRGYSEADMFYYGKSLTAYQENLIVSALSQYLEREG